jgi:hypothetical protein
MIIFRGFSGKINLVDILIKVTTGHILIKGGVYL